MNEKCVDCKAPATQLSPMPLCSMHWTDRYAKGPLRGEDGELLPYKKSLKDVLKEKGLWKKEDETVPEWQQRCEKAAKKSKFLGGS